MTTLTLLLTLDYPKLSLLILYILYLDISSLWMDQCPWMELQNSWLLLRRVGYSMRSLMMQVDFLSYSVKDTSFQISRYACLSYKYLSNKYRSVVLPTPSPVTDPSSFFKMEIVSPLGLIAKPHSQAYEPSPVI